MARDVLTYASGNSASTTLSSTVTGSDTTFPLTSDTNFNAKSGEGMVIIDEGAATEEFGYATGKSGGALTIPLANRGLEGGSAQGHASGSSVKGIITSGMWNDVIDSLANVLTKATGAVDGTKVVKVSSNDALLPAAASNIQVNGADPKRGIYIPASAMFPATTTGCASLAQGETATNKINYKYLAFDQSTEEYAWIHIPAPSYWDLSTITAEFHWTAASGTGDVIWGIAGLARSNDDALDTALGSAVTVTDTLIATGDQHLTSDTGAITIGGTAAKDDHLFIRVYRDADAGGDTLNADAHLIGVTLRFGRGQYDDQ